MAAPLPPYPAFGPVARLGLGILRPWFGDAVTIGTQIPADLSDKMPFILVRADRRTGRESGVSQDERFLRTSLLSVEAFTSGLNAESDGFDIEESARMAIYHAWRNQIVVPGAGSIAAITSTTDIARVSDYATSTGVVQYASLPKGTVRHEGVYQLLVRPPKGGTANRFIPSQYA
ncbi:hypothetical protein [Brevibacterium album]|uniref:hypothetical protein n=1 Tax=Brevibacterium album TaxID=417948 RepID=UPI000422AF63|nr:hypothetical protein [Brevibacterium album]